MNRESILPKDARAAQRKHLLAYACLLFAILFPMVVGIKGLGLLLKRLFPSPTGLVIFAGGCLLIAAIVPLCLLGAFAWLLMARRVVPRSVVRAFAVHPRFGILSRMSKWMFVLVYGDDDERHAQPSDELNAGRRLRRLS